MTIARNLKIFLDENKVKYHLLKHHEFYTSQEIAAALHVSGQELAKVVMIKTDKGLVMVVLPASFRIDLNALPEALNVREAELATETEFKGYFPDCEVGAMPPFGNLYGLSVYVDQSLTEDVDIVFEAGNHQEAIKMNYEDFQRLVKPTIADFIIH